MEEKEMKKKFKAILLGILISICAVFGVACKEEEIDYTKDELTIKQMQYFDTCYFYEFFRQNEHTKTFFKDIMPMLIYDANVVKVTVDGDQWTPLDLVKNELPFGIYKLTMEVNRYFPVWDENLEQYVQEPYNKKLTLRVSVLPIFEDKYKSASAE